MLNALRQPGLGPVKKSVAMFSLLLSITGTLCAQKNGPLPSPDDQFFNLPHFSILQAWHIDLGKNNYLELELADRSQLSRFQNLDSLLLVFLSDMKVFKDSLTDPLSGKRIDYLVDTAGRKMVRIRETRSPGASFLLGEGEPSLLRLRQDTLCLLLLAPPDHDKKTKQLRYSRLTIVLNRYSDLENWVTTGLNTKMQELATTAGYTWGRKYGRNVLLKDPSITDKNDSIYSAHRNDYLSLDAIISLQNYKNYLTPSVDLGATIGLRHRNYLHEFGMYWEPLFLFASDAKGRPQTYRNDLLVFRYAFDVTGTIKDPLAPVGLNTNISLGYFIRRSGDYFEKGSFRLTAGEIKFRGNRILLQPCIYFNNLFKDVTPGLRLCYRPF
jgi:hypothetical protein